MLPPAPRIFPSEVAPDLGLTLGNQPLGIPLKLISAPVIPVASAPARRAMTYAVPGWNAGCVVEQVPAPVSQKTPIDCAEAEPTARVRAMASVTITRSLIFPPCEGCQPQGAVLHRS